MPIHTTPEPMDKGHRRTFHMMFRRYNRMEMARVMDMFTLPNCTTTCLDEIDLHRLEACMARRMHSLLGLVLGIHPIPESTVIKIIHPTTLPHRAGADHLKSK
jgi:hypothetical protein